LPGTDDAARREATSRYEAIGGEAFRRELAQRDAATAARLAPGDRQRLIRAWEVVESTGIPLSAWQARPRDPGHDLAFRLVGLLPDRVALYDRIDRRFDTMLDRGVLDEARRFDDLGLSRALPANRALGLPELRRHLAGEPGPGRGAARGAAGDPQLCETPDDLVPPPVAGHGKRHRRT